MLSLDSCSLRMLKDNDLPLVLGWRNSDRVRPYMFHDHIITQEEHQTWYQGLKESKQTICRIFEADCEPLGLVNIYDINRNHATCKWGFYIGENQAPKGSGTALGYLSLEYIFHELALRKCCAEILFSNQASLHFHRKLGFEEEGRLVRHLKRRDLHYEDVILMALFANRWNEIKDNVLHIDLGRSS